MEFQLTIIGKSDELTEVLAALRPVFEQKDAAREKAAQEAARERLLDRDFTGCSEPPWSVRTYNCLVKAEITTLRALVACTEEQLRGIRNFGSRSVNEVKEELAKHDLSLAEP
ncbi:MAG: DNA-directed RNA polymerase subunit alpha C-terminal domain-containing protein [Patescibacteria group bacterium]